MAALTSVSSEAFERWPERLRDAGFEVEFHEYDGELGTGRVSKGWRSLEIALPRNADGTALVFGKGWCFRRGKLLSEIIAALRKEDVDKGTNL